MTDQPKGLHRVRWIAGEDPEMQCASCFEFLPLTTEFWDPRHGTRRCKVCWAEAKKSYHAEYMRKFRAKRRDAKNPAVAANYDANWKRRNTSLLSRYLRRTA